MELGVELELGNIKRFSMRGISIARERDLRSHAL